MPRVSGAGPGDSMALFDADLANLKALAKRRIR
jgi:hypothetical protein